MAIVFEKSACTVLADDAVQHPADLRRLLLYCGLYALLWTILTVALDPTVPYDALEALNWAVNGEWGSPKNPWLVGMLFRPATEFSTRALSLYWYLGHFTGVAIGLMGVWALAYRLSGCRQLAWLALLTLNLSGVINFDIIPYNDNYLLVALWPWMLLLVIKAAFDDARYWLAFSAVAGLATMAKYSTLAFIGSLFLLTLTLPSLRRCYRCRWFYAGLFLGILLVLPNVIWLLQHQLAAFKWVESQITQQLNGRALIAAMLIFYPLGVLVWLLSRAGAQLAWPALPEKQVVLLLYLVPVSMILLYFTLHQGGRITEWLQPFMVPAPAILVGCCLSRSPNALRRSLWSLAGCALLFWLGYAIVMSSNIRNAGQKYVGIKALSGELQQYWQQRYATPLYYVGGSHLAHWLTFYASDRPQVITRWSNEQQPNIYNAAITHEHLQQRGALLLSSPGVAMCQAELFAKALSDWPGITLSDMTLVHFRASPRNQEEPVCIAVIAPQRPQP